MKDVEGQKQLQERREQEEWLWTEMPSISRGAKTLETVPSFRESTTKEGGKINSWSGGEGTVRAGNCL